MTLPRLLLVVLVLTMLGAVTGGIVGVLADDPVPRAGGAPSVPAPAARSPRGLEVLREWDVRRAAAWSHGEEAALRRLYVAGSSAGARDVTMLRSWRERGLRVRGMRMQVLAVRVAAAARDRIVLEVTDRLAHAVAVGRGARVLLPRDTATDRTVTLRRVAGEWRVAEVRAQPSPAASTPATSRSRKS